MACASFSHRFESKCRKSWPGGSLSRGLCKWHFHVNLLAGDAGRFIDLSDFTEDEQALMRAEAEQHRAHRMLSGQQRRSKKKAETKNLAGDQVMIV